MTVTNKRLWLAIGVLALGAGACGGDDDDSTASDGATEDTATDGATEDTATDGATETTVAGEDQSVFELSVGMCLDETFATGTVQEVPELPCDQPHWGEVYDLFDIDGDEFPGEAAVDAAAQEGCLASFAGYVGVEFAQSGLLVNYLVPTAESWAGADDREVVCFAYSDGEPLTGSAQGLGI